VSARTSIQSDQSRIAILVVGDLVALLVFSAIGRSSHGEAAGIAAIPEIIMTAAPFILGWLLVAPWLGAYREPNLTTPVLMLRTTLLAWLATLPVALILRSALIGRLSPISFAVVTFVAVALLLGGWRLVYALWHMRRNGSRV
jgi:hypothetical protein